MRRTKIHLESCLGLAGQEERILDVSTNDPGGRS